MSECSQDREALLSATSDFLQGQLALTRRDFTENAQKMDRARIEKNAVTVRLLTLEAEVLEASYKSLLAKAEEAKLAANIEGRQIGERFRVLDVARLPEKPLGPTRLGLTFVGAVAGLCLGLALVAVSAVRRSGQARTAKS